MTSRVTTIDEVELIRSVAPLRVLAAVEGSASFAEAADLLGITQSAVSQHLATLERQVGLPLVLRGTKPVELTRAGRVLAAHAVAVTARLEAASLDLAALAGDHHRRLRLGGFPTALATIVPPALARLSRQMPEVSLTVVDDHLHDLLPRLLAHELDVAVIFDDAADPTLGLLEGFEMVPLFVDQYRLLIPLGHRLARTDRTPRLEDLAEETWVGGTPGSSWFQIVRGRCRTAGFEPRVGIATDDYLAVQAFVAAGLGIAVVPGLVASRHLQGVGVRTLAGVAPSRRIVVGLPLDPYRPLAAGRMADLLSDLTAWRRPAPGRAPVAAPRPPAG